MLKATAVVGETEIYDKIKSLYLRAFAENERGPLEVLLKDKSGHSEIVALFDDETFCGFMCIINYQDIMHIIYFAIDEKFRERGYGSKALEIARKLKPNSRIIVDIERDVEGAVNKDERIKRKAFYLKNGYQESGIKYDWKGESYEILNCGGQISVKEYMNFWKSLEKTSYKFAQF